MGSPGNMGQTDGSLVVLTDRGFGGEELSSERL